MTGIISNETASATEIRRLKWRIWRNVGFVSLSFMCFFAASGLVSNLQSTINSSAGLGNMSQSVIYITQIISSMFASTAIMTKFGLKWSMVLGQLCYAVYIVAQFYPCFGTLIPAAVVVGFGAAPLWSAKSSYLAQMGIKLAGMAGHKESAEASMSRFYGFFALALQSSTVLGNFIGSHVLSSTKKKHSSKSYHDLSECGAQFCYDDSSKSDESPSHHSSEPLANVPMLMTIMLAISLQATLLLVIMVDPSPVGESDALKESRSGKGMLMATFRQLKNPSQLLVIPLTLWTGFETAFWSSDFTYAFITCSMGAENIGYVLMYYGAAAAISALVFGCLIGRIGRIPFFLIGASISISLLFTMQFIWTPDPSNPAAFFLVSFLWGTSHSTVSTALNTLYGVVFVTNKEAAFSNFRLWQSIGFAVPLAYANYICVRTKLFILMTMVITATVGYILIEIREHRKKNSSNRPLLKVKAADE